MKLLFTVLVSIVSATAFAQEQDKYAPLVTYEGMHQVGAKMQARENAAFDARTAAIKTIYGVRVVGFDSNAGPVPSEYGWAGEYAPGVFILENGIRCARVIRSNTFACPGLERGRPTARTGAGAKVPAAPQAAR